MPHNLTAATLRRPDRVDVVVATGVDRDACECTQLEHVQRTLLPGAERKP
jgi:hypothetical protein